MDPPPPYCQVYNAVFDKSSGPMGLVIEDRNGTCTVVEITEGMIATITLYTSL